MELYTLTEELGSHCMRVQLISDILLRESKKIPLFDIENITKSAGIHDIGKVMLPNDVLCKPGRLTDAEFNSIKRHTTYGYEIIRYVGRGCSEEFSRYAKEIALLHHERVDGSGYPFGMAGNRIPLEIQIIGIADAFDAMSSSRSYKKAYDYDTAYKLIEQGLCGEFSKNIVRLLKDSLGTIERELVQFSNANKYTKYRVIMTDETMEIVKGY